MDLEFKHNRALKLLREKQHHIGDMVGSHTVTVDEKQYTLEGLVELVNSLYPEEWAATQICLRSTTSRQETVNADLGHYQEA